MLPAAVGFQCPSCVKDGAKATRTGRLPYGGERVANPALTSFVLIGINVVVWLGIAATGGYGSTLLHQFELIPHYGLYVDQQNQVATLLRGVGTGAWWQVITSAFTHVSALHIALNMFALYYLGPQIEQILGRVRFLAVYLVSALAGSAGVMLFSAPHTPTVGASGAIFGLMGAFGIIALRIKADVRGIALIVGLNLVLTFSVSNISWQGHLGGLVGGALATAAIVYAPKGPHRSKLQWAALALIAGVSVALIVLKAVSFPDVQIPQGF
jgi:membrane associated rhomboid family serine protease